MPTGARAQPYPGRGPFLVEGTMVTEANRAEPLLHAERVERL